MNIDAWRHYLRARLLARLGRTDPAADAYRAALAVAPGWVRAAHGLAFLLGQKQHYGEAEATLRRALDRAPADAALWFNLGFVCERQGRIDTAVDAFREAVRLDPKFDQAWYGLGLLLGAGGAHEEALRAFERVIQIQPMSWPAWYALGMAHHHLHQADRVRDVAEYLNRYDRHRARKLILDTGRSDLAPLVADLRVP